jgi:hypothetical protein
MNAGPFDEFADRFEDEDTWLDDFDDRDEVFDAAAEAAIIDDPGLDWSDFEALRRGEPGLISEDDSEEDDEGIAA